MSVFYGQFVLLLGFIFASSGIKADGQVFVLNLRNSSGLVDYKEAEEACSAHQARVASADELRHAVTECFFSLCTRGWLHGQKVGMTICNVVGGSEKAVEVKIENATEESSHLDTYCFKDQGVPCGDPPSFPNTRLQEHSGFEMDDELLYTCAPGYTMPNGQSAFSLLCDSCGEWYGLVQICVKDEADSHIDYEDKFPDTYVEVEYERPEEARGEVYQEEKNFQQHVYFGDKGEGEEQDEVGDLDKGETVKESLNRRSQDEDVAGEPGWEQESREDMKTNEEATDAPVSLLSQKHLFWFPSEAFTNPISQTTQNTSPVESEESKEHKSKEEPDHQQGIEFYDHDHDTEESYHEIGDDLHDDADNQHDPDSHQEEDDLDDVKQYIPAQQEDLEDTDNHDDHYDMGEHEDDNVHYSRESDDHHESLEDLIEDHPGDVSEEHIDHDIDENHEQDDTVEDDGPDHSHENDDHVVHYEEDHHDHDNTYDQDHDNDHSEHDDDFSHEDNNKPGVFSIVRDASLNTTQKTDKDKSTDDTWLDGYPVSQAGKEKENDKPEEISVEATDRPNDVEDPHTRSPTDMGQKGVEVWPEVHSPTAPTENLLDSPTFFDTLDYNTQQEAPTHSWKDDLTDQHYPDHGPAPPLSKEDTIKERNVLNLPGEDGERGRVAGEMEEKICLGDNCPPTPPSRGPTVAAIISAVCVIAVAVMIGMWCYKQRQQKSSTYEMNGTGQTQTHQAQQIEMQQKV